MKKVIGIDFGTSNTFIYVPNKGSVYNEPTVIALDVKQRKVIETGYLAAKMIGRTSKDITISYPVVNGVIARINPSIQYLRKALKEAKFGNSYSDYVALFSVPSSLTPVEKNAIKTISDALDFSDYLCVNQGLLATIGASNDEEKSGKLCVNIGGGITDIVVSSNNNIIQASSSYFCGNLLDEAILRYLRKKHSLLVGKKTAEFIKMKIGSVEINPENRLIEVSGMNITTQVPQSIVISTVEIHKVCVSKMDELVDAITDVLALTPPELSNDIIANGICLCGGGALLAGMREYLEKVLSIPVRIGPDPITSVVNGMRIYIRDLKLD